jgi:hypothetical protein
MMLPHFVRLASAQRKALRRPKGEGKSNQEDLIHKMQPQRRTAARRWCVDRDEPDLRGQFGKCDRTNRPEGIERRRQPGRIAAARYDEVAIAFVALIGMVMGRFDRTAIMVSVVMATDSQIAMAPVARRALPMRVVPAATSKHMEEDHTHCRVVHQPVHSRTRL